MNISEKPVIIRRHRAMATIILNRPQALNSLNIEMIRLLTAHVRDTLSDPDCRFILLYGNGSKGFCAGADLRELAQAALNKDEARLLSFYREEYALDLMIHKAVKPVIVLAEGITMGGGLGIAAGADLILAAESTRMAMPETLIGFFPDVGATGWMFERCPRGYPEYLGLTGCHTTGGECVRLGLATHLMQSGCMPDTIHVLENCQPDRNVTGSALVALFLNQLAPFLADSIPANPDMDAWVDRHFAGKRTIHDVVASLRQGDSQHELRNRALRDIAERSPTALAATLSILRHNENRAIAEVFEAELKAAQYLSRHPDYVEGIRARMIDRDNRPRWQPNTHEAVDITVLNRLLLQETVNTAVQ
jgi:enoyl-CoA hydratase